MKFLTNFSFDITVQFGIKAVIFANNRWKIARSLKNIPYVPCVKAGEAHLAKLDESPIYIDWSSVVV